MATCGAGHQQYLHLAVLSVCTNAFCHGVKSLSSISRGGQFSPEINGLHGSGSFVQPGVSLTSGAIHEPCLKGSEGVLVAWKGILDVLPALRKQ